MDDRIEKVLNHIEGNPSLTLKLADLSAIACLSPSQFHRVFKKETKSTPFKFIEKIKMNMAYQLVMKECVRVFELAEHLGYNDYETFSRAFKKHFHISPDDFKAIVGKVKENLTPGEIEGLVVATFAHTDSHARRMKSLQQIVKEKNISEIDLKNAKIFKITQKSNSKIPSQNLIKNKYEIAREKSIWQSLIEER